MNVNATLLVQMITFAFFVWFTMKMVWPHLTKALEERQTKIAEGLAAGERGQRELELAQHKITEQLRDVKVQSADMLDKANRQAAQFIEDSKAKAREEGDRLLELARQDIDREIHQAKQQLRAEVAKLAAAGAGKIIQKEMNAETHAKMLDDLIEQL